MFSSCSFFFFFFNGEMILSKQDVIARSLNSRREVGCRCSKHVMYVQQVVEAYRTQKDTYINPVKTIKVRNPSHIGEGDDESITSRSGTLFVQRLALVPPGFTDLHSIERSFKSRQKPHVKLVVHTLEIRQNRRIWKKKKICHYDLLKRLTPVWSDSEDSHVTRVAVKTPHMGNAS